MYATRLGYSLTGNRWSMPCATSATSSEASNGRFIFVRAKP